jgi:hypothetical protein
MVVGKNLFFEVCFPRLSNDSDTREVAVEAGEEESSKSSPVFVFLVDHATV